MANIHYFQRYHNKENVHTANAFLLINRLYQYKPQYFYNFLETLAEDEQYDYDFRLNMRLQERSENKKGSTVPDAMIVQQGYRLCVEAKIGDWFHLDQVIGHLKSFDKLDTKYKIFLTLSNENECRVGNEIKKLTEEFNKSKKLFNEDRLIYKHLTFESLIERIETFLSDRDYEFEEILNDYRDYCFEQDLIDNKYQLMKAYAVGHTLKVNKKLNLYYRKSTDNIKADILGLYCNKKITAIGKIYKIVKASMPKGELVFGEGENVTNDEYNRIKEAIIDSKQYGYNLETVEHNFFLVEKFEDCDFVKTSKGGLFGGRLFALESSYGIKDIRKKSLKEIADELSQKSWE